MNTLKAETPEVMAIVQERPGEYKGLDNSGQPKLRYLNKICQMSEDEIYQETKNKIWLSAYASNNHRSDYHWQCDYCWNVLSFRGLSDVYKAAWEAVSKG